MDKDAFNDSQEIPLVAPGSLSSDSSSPPREHPSNPSGGGTGNAGPPPAGQSETTNPPPPPPSPPAIAAPISIEEVSKVDLAMMGGSIGLVVALTLNFKDLTGSWETRWKLLYGVLMIVSLASTVTGFFTAWCPAESWGRRLSTTCARFGLADAAALFIVFIACKLGHFGCTAGVASAALLVLLLAIWAWSEWQATCQVKAAAPVP